MNVSLFPNLWTLIIPKLQYRHNCDLALKPLLSPSLQQVELLAPGRAYLTQLQLHTPRLEHLRYMGSSSEASLLFISSFRHLRHLDINFHQSQNSHSPWYPTLLNALSTMPYLSSLLLCPPVDLNANQLSPTGFTQLKHLAITGDSRIFGSICRMTPNIEHLVLESRHREKPPNYTLLFELLLCSSPLLRHIHVFGNQLAYAKPLLLLEFIQPLLKYSLHSICLRWDGPFHARLSDSDSEALGRHWPELQHFDFFATGSYVTPNIPTLRSVAALTSACPNLTYLRMSIWNTAIEHSTYRPSSTLRNLDNTYPPWLMITDASSQ